MAASYGNGTMRVYVNGREARPPLRLYSMAALVLRAGWPGSSILTAALLFAPLGVLASAFIPVHRTHRWGRTVALGLCVGFLGPFVLSVTLSAFLQRGQDLAFLVSAAAAASLAIILQRAAAGRLAGSSP